MIWNAIYPDTSYHEVATTWVGGVASLAEEQKLAKYCNLHPIHSFIVVLVEMLGAIGARVLSL